MLKWSTITFPIKSIDKCLADYLGQGEQYGDNTDDNTAIISIIAFNNVTRKTIRILREIEAETNKLYTEKPERMPNIVHQNLVNLIENSDNYLANNDDIHDDFISSIISGAQSIGLIPIRDNIINDDEIISNNINGNNDVNNNINNQLNETQIIKRDKLREEMRIHLLNEVPKSHPGRKA